MINFAMIFPGQGSQKLGMLTTFAQKYTIIQKTFAEASDILGYDLWYLVQNGPIEKLNKTCQTQPALLTASISIWRVWQQQSILKPTLMAGHSLGEYSALVCSESLDFSTAIKIVTLRAKLMQTATPIKTGAMLVVIGLDNNTINFICKKNSYGKIVSPVSFNSPEQIVIAGHKEAVKRAQIECKKAGAKYTMLLPISVPSHCILMKSIANELAEILEKMIFSVPKIPVVNNVDVCIEHNPIAIRQALVRQLYNPVRWNEIIEFLSAQGIKKFIEIGPGNVLTKLVKNINYKLSGIAVNDPISLAKAIKE